MKAMCIKSKEGSLEVFPLDSPDSMDIEPDSKRFQKWTGGIFADSTGDLISIRLYIRVG